MVRPLISTRDQIYGMIAKGSSIGSSLLSKNLKLSRKTIAVHLKNLVDQGLIVKTGSTRNAKYHVAISKLRIREPSVELRKKSKGLQEDQVFSEVDLRLGLKKSVSTQTYAIIQYAFTEMLNNAIDHSKSKNISINSNVTKGTFEFVIRDFGIGIFKNIQRRFHLENQYQSVDHVLKGKQTTQPAMHSGEGLFFTSRIADILRIRSHRIVVTFDNRDHDHKVREERFLQGTEIAFQIKIQTRKKLDQLFKLHTNDDFEFKNGEMRITIHEQTGNFSRSQARRLCNGLEKYDRVVFDFRHVKGLGQAFADQIFRVFQSQYPAITLSFANAIQPVEFMILRAIRGASLIPFEGT